MNTTKWLLDASHSEINFKVKHLMISTVSGKFTDFSSTVETEGEDFSTAKLSFAAAVNSINTSNEQRDAHLRAADFFDAENYPELSFKSDKMEKIDDETYKLHGILNIRNVSKPVILDVEYGGTTTDPWGGSRAGFSLSGKINRKDFGISFGAVSETGGVLLGDEVKLSAEVQLVKQEVAELV